MSDDKQGLLTEVKIDDEENEEEAWLGVGEWLNIGGQNWIITPFDNIF